MITQCSNKRHRVPHRLLSIALLAKCSTSALSLRRLHLQPVNSSSTIPSSNRTRKATKVSRIIKLVVKLLQWEKTVRIFRGCKCFSSFWSTIQISLSYSHRLSCHSNMQQMVFKHQIQNIRLITHNLSL